jgi:hypothetical protein
MFTDQVANQKVEPDDTPQNNLYAAAPSDSIRQKKSPIIGHPNHYPVEQSSEITANEFEVR